MSNSSEFNARKINCPNCDAPLDILSQKSEAIVCKHCFAAIDVDKEFPELVELLANYRTLPHSFIELGMEANFGGKRYQVIGRISYSSMINEWDSEDSKYYREPWTYDEWTLVGENKEYIYIYEDVEGYAISYSVTPDKPEIPAPNVEFFSIFKDHPPQRIREFVSANIQYFEGEFTWVPKRGTRELSEEYEYGIESYSVSRRLDDANQVKEVEFFRSIPATKIEMARSFERHDIVAKIQEEEAMKEQYKTWSWGFFAASLICFFLAISSCSHNEKVLATYSFDFSMLGGEGVVQGPVYLRKKGEIHKITLSTSISDNRDAWGAVELLDSSQNPINAVDEEFWRESGYDDEGHWSEGNTSKSMLFILDNPGAYFVRLLAEPGSAASGKLLVTISEGIAIARYYVIAMFLSLGFGIAIRKYQSMNPWYAVIGMIALGFFLLEMMADSDD